MKWASLPVFALAAAGLFAGESAAQSVPTQMQLNRNCYDLRAIHPPIHEEDAIAEDKMVASCESAAAIFLRDIAKAGGGDAAAMTRVAEAYLYGPRAGYLARDRAQFLYWAKAAMGKGDPHAHYLFGRSSLAQRPPNVAAGVPALETAVARGHVEAMEEMAEYHLNGNFKPVDAMEAVRYYKMGAAKGSIKSAKSAAALYSLGVYGVVFEGFHFTIGRDVTRDPVKALAYTMRAVELGDVASMTNVGLLHAEGIGTPKNPAKALEWYRFAAKKGDAVGAYQAGMMLLGDRGVPANPAEALAMFRKGAEGDRRAAFQLGVAYSFGKHVALDKKEAIRWYRLAAEDGDLGAMNNLAWNLSQENGGKAADPNEVLSWYRKSADAGYLSAMANLYAVLKGGKYGIAKDEAEAAKWRAKLKGHAARGSKAAARIVAEIEAPPPATAP